MIVEYAFAWGPPDGDMPWPLFQLMLVRRTRQVARETLAVAQGVALAIAATFGESVDAQRDMETLKQMAHPGEKRTADEVFQKAVIEVVSR